VPLLVDTSGKKLSKREASVSVQSYRDRGFCREAVLNYIARLGWGHGDLEVFTMEELIEHFSLEAVGKSPSQVHDDKLTWLNQQYLRTLPAGTLLGYLRPFVEAAAGRPFEPDAGFSALIGLLRERSRTLVEMAERARFYWSDEIAYEPKAARKFLVPTIREPLAELRAALEAQPEWAAAPLRACFDEVIGRHGLGLGKLAQPVRVAITGGTASPGIFETLEALGRERSLARIATALDHIATAPAA
jgi:glutamyl-tRNA synthetase